MTAIDTSVLRRVLDYDQASGIFRWKECKRPELIGRVAGVLTKAGYIKICINQKKYFGHRLAWQYVTGDLPSEIDHRDGNPSNNKIDNLRPCSHAENMQNLGKPRSNTSGLKGAFLHKPSGRWFSRVSVCGQKIYLGYFDTPEQANIAYLAASIKLHGEFSGEHSRAARPPTPGEGEE